MSTFHRLWGGKTEEARLRIEEQRLAAGIRELHNLDQGNAVVNYTDRETPFTRVIEHKWFEFGRDALGKELPRTVVTREYPLKWEPGLEPYYPVNEDSLFLKVGHFLYRFLQDVPQL